MSQKTAGGDAQDVLCNAVEAHGLLLTRSWILTHLGRTAEALGPLSSVDPEVLGPRYSAEYYFTRALLSCAVGDVVAAEAAAEDGIRRAKRAASRRNALQIAAHVAVAWGNHERAIELLEAARTNAYRGQAAPGLVLLGKSYEAMDQPALILPTEEWSSPGNT